jgi:hypothetical protein
VKDFPPFRLDPGNQCLLRLDPAGNEQRVELKPKTFDVLRYLVDNPGRLITHEELLGEVWPDAEVQQEVLKSHVLAIRKATNSWLRCAPRRCRENTRECGLESSWIGLALCPNCVQRSGWHGAMCRSSFS